MNTAFDARGLKCPLAFVKTKQQLIKGKAKVFLFDDEISLYNFKSYLLKVGLCFREDIESEFVKITLVA